MVHLFCSFPDVGMESELISIYDCLYSGFNLTQDICWNKTNSLNESLCRYGSYVLSLPNFYFLHETFESFPDNAALV